MREAAAEVRDAIAAHLHARADLQSAEASGRDVALADRAAARARAALGTGEGRERLEEAVSTRALDEASYGALLEHLGGVAEDEVLARHSVKVTRASSDRVVVEDRERTLVELAMDARDPAPPRARAALAALLAHTGRDRAARLEAWNEVSERRARIRSRGPRMPDDAQGDLSARASAFLDATDDAAADLVERAHHAVGAPSLATRVAALAPLALDGALPARGRTRRIGAVLESLGLEGELRDRISLAPTRVFTLRPDIVRRGAHATVLVSDLEAGVVSERAMFWALAQALTHVLFSRSLPVEHAHAPRASVARSVGALFGAFLSHESLVRRHVDAAPAARARVVLSSSLAIVLEARLACVRAMAGEVEARTDAHARELAARALVLDPSLMDAELARSSWISPTDAETDLRAVLAALAWAPALRERYDEDFFRNPRLADFLRGAAARGGLASAEGISDELGATPAHAALRVVELAERAGG